MTKKQITIVIVLGVVVFGGIVIGIFFRNAQTPQNGPAAPEGNPSSGETVISKGEYTSEVPKNATLTVPVHEAPAAPNVPQTLGIFSMTVSENGFNPDSITVKNGNLVQINLTAVGVDFDFSMPYTGLYTMVKKGETKQVSFQTTGTGTFVFECRDHCPPSGKIQGTVIVIP